MGTSDSVEDSLSGLQAEMIGIVQTKSASCLFQLLWRESLERRLGRDWHENGKLKGAMREV